METWSHVPIVGGPRDGDEVPYSGQQFFEPIPRRLTRADYLEPGKLPASHAIQRRVYDLHKWQGEDGRIVPRYVLREQAKGLGAST